MLFVEPGNLENHQPPLPSSDGVTKQRQKFSESIGGQMHHEVVTMRNRQENKERYPKLLSQTLETEQEIHL
ncbi:hypothetical protein Bca4012_049159 [Brassica carinata]